MVAEYERDANSDQAEPFIPDVKGAETLRVIFVGRVDDEPGVDPFIGFAWQSDTGSIADKSVRHTELCQVSFYEPSFEGLPGDTLEDRVRYFAQHLADLPEEELGTNPTAPHELLESLTNPSDHGD